jgi:asparagine synthase (glutamine-hydrolysing)
MCGIAGIFHYRDEHRPADLPTLQRMTRSIAHRGPDDEGFFVSGPLGLGNRRLAIVDMSPSGHQPMKSDDEASCITYNGEFYNHQSFRPKLQARGTRFRGSSDTETLLYALHTYGPGVLTDVAGIFGLAFWDARRRRLILARDPLGVKQLYYHDDGQRIVFASEIKALLQCPDVPRDIDPEAVNEYVHFHTTLFERTFFRHIRQVRAGEYLEIGRFGVRRKIYWETDGFQPRDEDAERSVEILRDLLETVVDEQLMSDVPVGAYFSGGIDSSAVAAFAKRSGHEPKLFGIHFSHQNIIDERPYQESAAAALGLDLHLTTVDGNDFPDEFLKLAYYQDQPVIGPALIPMYHVSRLAAGYVKVCLGGQAADEVFGGYARYALVHPAQAFSSWFSGQKAVGREPGQKTVSREPVSNPVGRNLMKQVLDLQNIRRFSRSVGLGGWRRRYFDNFAKVPQSVWRRVLPAPEFISRQRARNTFHDGVGRSPAQDPGDKILHWDMQTYLTGLFQQDDRMSMANSLESRVPIADPRVVRFALHTRFDLKLRGGATKWILRRAVSDVIPSFVLGRRKVGFDTPAESWMRDRHPDFVRDLLLSQAARERGLYDPAAVQALLGAPRTPYWFDIVWKLASIEAWASTFLDTAAVSNDHRIAAQSA